MGSHNGIPQESAPMTTTYAERLKSALGAKGWGVKQLARETGLSYSTLKGLENGHQRTSTDTPVIAAALGVSAVWLATGEGHRVQPERDSYVKGNPAEMRITSQIDESLAPILARAESWVRFEEKGAKLAGREPWGLDDGLQSVRRARRLIALTNLLQQHGGDLPPEEAAKIVSATQGVKHGKRRGGIGSEE